MWELFGALFGGGWLFGKIKSDTASKKAYERKRNKVQEICDDRRMSWRAMAGHAAIEEDLKQLILDPKNYDVVWREVHSAYLHMPLHRDYREIPLNSYAVGLCSGNKYTEKERENIAKKNREIALHIMLARRGKVPVIYTTSDLVIDAFSPGMGETSKRVWDEKYEFWGYIVDELRRNGVNSRLLFLQKLQSPAPNDPYRIKEVACDYKNVPRYVGGYIKWWQQTAYDDNLQEL